MATTRVIEPVTYSSQEAADFLGVSVATLWRLMNAGELSYLRVRNRRRFTQEILDAYLRKSYVDTTPPRPRQRRPRGKAS